MRLDLSRAFVTDGFDAPVSGTILPPEDYVLLSGDRPDGALSVAGRLYNRADVLPLDLDVSYDVTGACARCCEQVRVSRIAPIRCVLVKEKQNEEQEDIIEVSGDSFEVDSLVLESVLLDAPSRLLCREDCRGLCPVCGQNLNEKKCDCRQEQSPFDILKQQPNG